MSAMTQNFSTQVSGQNCPDQNMVTLHLKSMGSWVQITKTINKAHIIRPSHDDLMDLKGSNESLIMSYVGAHHICFHHMCSTQPDVCHLKGTTQGVVRRGVANCWME